MNLYSRILYSNVASDGNGKVSDTAIKDLKSRLVTELLPTKPLNHGYSDTHGQFGNYEHETPRGTKDSPLAD